MYNIGAEMTADPKRLWILEGDEGCQLVYKEILGEQYDIRCFLKMADLKSALATDKDSLPDLVIADLTLPDDSFLDFLSGLTGRPTVPFLVVSAMDDRDILRFCFEKGVSDYITKPFSRNELFIKIERILAKRSGVLGADKQEGDCVLLIDRVFLCVTRDGFDKIELTSKELQIVSSIYEAPGFSISRVELMNRVWGGMTVSSKTLDVHVFNIRKKLKELCIEVRYAQPNEYIMVFHKKR